MNEPTTRLAVAARRFAQRNLASADSYLVGDVNRHPRQSRELIATVLVARLPLGAGTAVMKSTYGQQIVAAVLMAEARGVGEIGMTAVAEVIRNRAAKASKSPLRIVLKPGEFSCLNSTTPAALCRKFYRMRTYQTALRIAKTCYNSLEALPNLTQGATFFDDTQNSPPWLCDLRPVTNIGNHIFYVRK